MAGRLSPRRQRLHFIIWNILALQRVGVASVRGQSSPGLELLHALPDPGCLFAVLSDRLLVLRGPIKRYIIHCLPSTHPPWQSAHSPSEDASQCMARERERDQLTPSPSPWGHLDVREGGKLAVCQALDHHQRRHQLVLVNVLQNLRDLTFALSAGGEEGESLHPQIWVLSAAGGGRSKGQGSPVTMTTHPCLLQVAMTLW